ncbi:hypothetical protein BZA70DRAFT_281066 [Myxozyma melibiosi]|uniref:CUE domain-containing protein n=1 Tax=Myxozyma melibiosi TaxID=54550 RepID=A0ABR1F3Y9_9ASCO
MQSSPPLLLNPPTPPYPSTPLRRALIENDPQSWHLCLETWHTLATYFRALKPADRAKAVHFRKFLASFVSVSRDDDDLDQQQPDEQSEVFSSLKKDVYWLLTDEYSRSSTVSNIDMFWGFVALYIPHHSDRICTLFETFTSTSDQLLSRLQEFLLDRVRRGVFRLAELHAAQLLLARPAVAGVFGEFDRPWVKGLRSIVGAATKSDPPPPPLSSSSSSSTTAAATPAEIALKLAYLSIISLATTNPDGAATLLKRLLALLPPPAEVLPGEMLVALVVRTRLIPRLRGLGAVGTGLEGIVVSLETVRYRLPAGVERDVNKYFRRTARRREKKTQQQQQSSSQAAKKDEKKKEKQAQDDALLSVLDEEDAAKVVEIRQIFDGVRIRDAITLLAEHDKSVEGVIGYLVDHPEVYTRVSSEGESESESDREKVAEIQVDDEAKEEEELARRLDTLDFEPGTIHIGKRPALDADAMLHSTASERGDKQKIFDALALIYDEDEADERDDTYDDLDAGVVDDEEGEGLVSEVLNPEQQQRRKQQQQQREEEDPNEKMLWELYSRQLGAFETKMRGSKQRAEVKSATGWSDEQVEGWAKMLARDVSLFFFTLLWFDGGY